MIGYVAPQPPHRYQVGDRLRCKHGLVGTVTEVFPYSVVLDGRLWISQTGIEGRAP